MDSLTQIAIGIATVEALAGKELKNRSFVIGTVLGTIPDLDVWIGKLFNYETELAFHRSFTHSVFGLLLMSPLLGYCLQKLLPVIALKRWIWIVLATLSTHVAIDLFTAWGVQLFYPLTGRYSFKTIFVVDVFYTLPWIVGLFILFRNKAFQQRKKILKTSFIISTSYLLLTVLTKFWVLTKVEEQINQQNLKAAAVIVKPTFSNIILWNVNVKTADGYYIGDYSLFDTKGITFDFFARDIRLEQKLDSFPSIQQLIQVSENWYTYTRVDDGIWAFNDVRFGWINTIAQEKQFVFSYKVILNGDDLKIEPMPKSIKDGKAAVLKIWNRICQPR